MKMVDFDKERKKGKTGVLLFEVENFFFCS